MNNDAGVAIKRANSGRNNGEQDTAGGGIERVNVFDGLFLRAEHLNDIQDYARDLAMAVGVAGGPGVVFGFGVELKGDTVEIAPGLAIDPYGQPLRTRYPITLSLKEFDPASGNFAWIEIVAASWTYGNEPVQGVLCEDPCSGGASSDARQAEGVQARLAPGFVKTLAGTVSREKRSHLASVLFAQERFEHSTWPFPGDEPSWPRSQQRLLTGQNWLPAADRTAGNLPGVRLAVVIPDQGRWHLDTWTARRDRGDPPPMRYWQTQLGMRPWDVFVAQILQFQDLLGVKASAPQMITEVRKSRLAARLNVIADSLEGLRGDITKRVAADRLRELEQSLAAKVRPPLTDVGILELPPAGFLGVSTAKDRLNDELLTLLGGPTIVDLRLCHGPVSDLGAFLHSAQHRDRIPLKPGPQPIDIFVPDDLVGDWVAFARREQRVCATAPEAVDTDPVDVHVIKQEDDDDGPTGYGAWRTFLEGQSAEHPSLPEKPDATVQYPPRAWALPSDGETIMQQLFDQIPRQGGSAIAIVSDPARRALGVARAGLLALHVDKTESFGVEIRCIVDTDSQGTESIVVLIPRGSDNG